jgi:hypothetical protein
MHTSNLKQFREADFMKKILAIVTLMTLALFLTTSAMADTTVSFTGLTDNTNGNGEVNGTEFVGQGLLLTLNGGLAFNVGCGTGNSCLGADAQSVNDFNGTLTGSFLGNTVGHLAIALCCEGNTGATTITLYDGANNVLASFTGTDINYTGAGVDHFQVTFGFDAMSSLTFGDVNETPEPGSLVLMGSGLLGLGGAIRRKLIS